MSVNREELKRLIDQIPDQDAAEVLDFIGYLNMKRERKAAEQLDIKQLSTDESLIRQVQKSREDRQAGRIYEQEAGLDYLRAKVEEFERGQSL
jgi:hypothetical protein